MATKVSMLEHALGYAHAGLPVIPLHHVLADGGCSCDRGELCPSPGKHPLTPQGLKDATVDRSRIEKWWKRWPKASIGGVCGSTDASMFICVDVDPKHGGYDSLARLLEANTDWPDTAVAMTGDYEGERGRHYWFRVPDDFADLPATRVGVREGIDIRCANGYAVLPPSPHASGVSYEWEHGSMDAVVEAPAWVLHLVPVHVAGDSTWTPNPSFRMSKVVKQFLEGEIGIEPGQQREFLTQAARSVLTTGRDVETTSQLLWEGYNGDGGITNCEWSDEPWMPEEVYALVSDIFAKPPTSPLEKDFSTDEFSLDDAGNAMRLIKSFPNGEVVYTPQDKRWYVWSREDQRFFRDAETWMHLRWLTITEEIDRQARAARSEDSMKALQRHAHNSRQKPRVEAAVTMGGWHAAIPITELDSDPYLFACENGVIDLRDGSLFEETPNMLITQRSPAIYDDRAKSRLFDRYLKRSVPDEELRDFLQLAIGYTLTGVTVEHAFFYVYGKPASGKTTLLETLKRLIGNYGIKAQSQTFMRVGARGPNSSSDDLARLAGKRFVYTTEVEQGERLSVALVSELVGGDTMTARFLYGSYFEYKPQFKLWFAANELPRVSGSARSGLWRRVKVLPFNETIPHDERDPMLPRQLQEPEAQSAFLAWAVEGACRWYENMEQGRLLPEPEAVTEQTEAYEREADHVNQFIAEALEITGDPYDRVPVPTLFKHYTRWCELEGRTQRRTQHQLSHTLVDRDLVAKTAHHSGKSQRCWLGVQLNELPGSGINIKGATK